MMMSKMSTRTQNSKTRVDRILGIDPGIERTGVGIIDVIKGDPLLVYVDCIVTKRTESHSERMNLLTKELQRVIKKYKPTRASVEKLFFSKNVRTAMSVAESRGAILLTLQQAGLSITEWTPQQIKQNVTGYGKADKRQIQHIVCAILKIKKAPAMDDATDALACALASQNLNFAS